MQFSLQQRLAKHKALPERCYLLAIVLLLLLSNVFSSRIQETLPALSRVMRLALTGGAAALLLVKVFVLTPLSRRQWWFALALVGYTGLQTVYCGDVWFVLAALLGLGAVSVDLDKAMRVFLAAAAAGLAATALLHAAGLVPYWDYGGRAVDFGFGHYNGYGGRLLGLFLAYAWLRWGKYRWYDYAAMAAAAFLTMKFVTSRATVLAMVVLLALLLACRVLPGVFRSRFFGGCVCAAPLVLLAVSLLVGYCWPVNMDNMWDGWDLWRELSWISSLRLPMWRSYFGTSRLSLLGGLPTNDGVAIIDNAYLSILMNKGYLGAVVVGVLVLLLLYRLARRRDTRALVLMLTMLVYLVLEDKPFLFSTNPLVMLLPAIFTPDAQDSVETT